MTELRGITCYMGYPMLGYLPLDTSEHTPP